MCRLWGLHGYGECTPFRVKPVQRVKSASPVACRRGHCMTYPGQGSWLGLLAINLFVIYNVIR